MSAPEAGHLRTTYEPSVAASLTTAEDPHLARLAHRPGFVARKRRGTGDWNDPEWLERARTHATRFTLSEGAGKALELKLASGG